MSLYVEPGLERKLPTPTVHVDHTGEGKSLIWIIGAIVVLAVIAIVFNIFLPAESQANEMTQVHQNDYYCHQIEESHEEVLGASDDEVSSLCAKYVDHI